MPSKAVLTNREIKSDPDLCPFCRRYLQPFGRRCRSTGSAPAAQTARGCALLCLCPSAASPHGLSHRFQLRFGSLGGRAVSCVGCTAAATGPPRAEIASGSVLQVGEAVGDFRDGMSSQMCSGIAAMFIPGRNAVLPVGSQGIMEQ